MNAFQKGMDAFKKGRLGNPYRPNTKDNRDWEFGFNKAYFKNKELVVERELRERSKKVYSAKA